MGFFSNLLSTIAPIASSFLGIPQAAAPMPVRTQLAVIPPAATLARPPTPDVITTALATTGPGAISTPADRAAIGRVLGSGTRAALGGSKNRIQTEILTINPAGQVIGREVRDGRPWLMRTDFVVMKRVLRTLSAGNKRVPRKVTRSRQQAEELAMVKGLVKGLISGKQGITVIDTD